MQHGYFKDLFAPYLDGLLSEDEKRKFEEHISECPECKTELADTQFVMHVLSSLPDEEVPFDIASRVKQEIQAPAQATSFISKINLKYLSIAAVFILMIALTVLGSPSDILYAPKGDSKQDTLVAAEKAKTSNEETASFRIANTDEPAAIKQAQQEDVQAKASVELAPRKEAADNSVQAKIASEPTENNMLMDAESKSQASEMKTDEEKNTQAVKEKDLSNIKIYYVLALCVTAVILIFTIIQIKKRK